MIVQRGLLTHPKFTRLENAVGADALKYLLRLWGHCEEAQRGGNWRHADEEYVESVCGWTGEPGLLFAALSRAPMKGKAGWIEVKKHAVIIHHWESINATLVNAWRAGRKGGRPKTSRLAAGKPAANQPGTRLDGMGLDGMGVEGSKADGSGVSGQTHAPFYPPPSLEQVFEHARKCGWPWTEPQIRVAWLAFESAKTDDGSWFWGKKICTDWRAAMEVRLHENEKESPARINTSAVNGSLMEIRRRLEELEGSEEDSAIKERRSLLVKRDRLVEELEKATKLK